MIQFGYDLHAEGWKERHNQVIDDLQKLFLPDVFIRYQEAEDILVGIRRRRFDILPIEMMNTVNTLWQEQVKNLDKRKIPC